jgi:hypothetical protein
MRFTMLPAVCAVMLAGACAPESRAPELTGPDQLVIPLFAANGGAGHNFGTHLSNREEVPANTSRAQGQAVFTLSADGLSLAYTLIVANIVDVTQSHIHMAPAGANGGIVAWLYPSAPPLQLIPGRSQGILGQGVITAANLVGALAGQTLQDLLDAIAAGNTYVNVHTVQLPPGEIRGQID